jgi:hypothetical protein
MCSWAAGSKPVIYNVEPYFFMALFYYYTSTPGLLRSFPSCPFNVKKISYYSRTSVPTTRHVVLITINIHT